MLGVGNKCLVVLAIAAMSALGACATVTNKLKPGDVNSFHLTEIDIKYAKDANIQWENGRRAYAEANNIPFSQAAFADPTPESRKFIRDLLAKRIRTIVENDLRPVMVGSRPVRLVITVHHFTIASVVQRALLGGGHMMVAAAKLVDVETGTTILDHPSVMGMRGAAAGLTGVALEAAYEAVTDPENMGKYANPVISSYSDNLRTLLKAQS